MAIIDGGSRFAIRIRRAFESAGWEVEPFDPARDFDLIFVGVERDGSGLETLHHLRAQGSPAVIAVTSDAQLHTDALLAGADESFLESGSARELLARADAVLRRARPAYEPAAYEDDEVKIFPDAMHVLRNGRQIPLSKGESDVLTLLIRHSPLSLPVERIRQEVAAVAKSVSRSAIEARLKALRRKLGPDLIANRIGFGYSFQPRQRRRA